MGSVHINLFRFKIIFVILFLMLLVSSCNNKQNNNILIKAITVNSQYFGASDFSIEVLKDSTYKMVDYSIDINDSTFELIVPKKDSNIIKGKTIIKNNVLYFDKLNKYHFDKAIIQNGFMDLYRGYDFYGRLLVDKINLPIQEDYNNRHFPDYVIFNIRLDSIEIKNSYLHEKDLRYIDSVLKNEFKNNYAVKKIDDYHKQIKVYSNSDSVVVIANLFLKKNNKISKEDLQYQPIIPLSGVAYEGYYGEIKINLTKHSFSKLLFFEEY